MVYDAVMIGSGLAGLTAGAELARRGRKVLVLEQHDTLGGCAAMFKRKGFTFEAGLHAFGGFDAKGIIRKLERRWGNFGQADFIPLPEFFRWVGPGGDMVVPARGDAMQAHLEKVFPREKRGLHRYFSMIRGMYAEACRVPPERLAKRLLFPLFPALFPKLVFNRDQSLGHFLDETIGDETLKLVLAGNLIFYHDDPYTLSLDFFAVAQGGFFAGPRYIRGGSRVLVEAMARMIRDAGGTLATGRQVTEILVRRGRAVGVIHRARKEDGGKTDTAFAHAVIANAAVPNLTDMLPQGAAQRQLEQRTANLVRSHSLLSVYLGFQTGLERFGVRHFITVAFGAECRRLQDFRANNRGAYGERNFIFTDYGRIDGQTAPPGKTAGAICTTDYLDGWEGLDADAYAKKKAAAAETLIRRLDNIYPGIAKAVEYCEVATPHTIRRYTLNPGGSVYGFAQTPGQAADRRFPQYTPVKNLYLASAWTDPGGGFVGAMESGLQAAGKVLNPFA